MGDRLLHHGPAGFAVGDLEGIVLEPAQQRAFANVGLLRRCIDGRLRQERSYHRFLFATYFSLGSCHKLSCPAIYAYLLRGAIVVTTHRV